jgi:hypothetical protein
MPTGVVRRPVPEKYSSVKTFLAPLFFRATDSNFLAGIPDRQGPIDMAKIRENADENVFPTAMNYFRHRSRFGIVYRSRSVPKLLPVTKQSFESCDVGGTSD